MSRRVQCAVLVLAAVAAVPGRAQDAAPDPSPPAANRPLEPQQGSPPQRIDLLANRPDVVESAQEPDYGECGEDQDAAIITGEIVVCRRLRNDAAAAGWDQEAFERRYAEATMYRGDPAPTDVAGKGIFRGPATVGGLCLIPPCPPPPAYIIDFDELPDAPPGSDADRIARGLAPRGRDGATPQPARPTQEELGLPEPGETLAPPVSPSESASPAAPRSD